MSSTVVHGSQDAVLDAFHERLLATSPRPSKPSPSRSFVRRRGSLAQGRALETIGHAVEYLMDSAIFLPGRSEVESNQAAIQILMRLSRAVFEECPEVLPVRARLRRWSQRVIARALGQHRQPVAPDTLPPC